MRDSPAPVLAGEYQRASDLIDVKVEGRKDTVLIPFADGYVLEADADKLVVDLPEGFLDEGQRDGEPE